MAEMKGSMYLPLWLEFLKNLPLRVITYDLDVHKATQVKALRPELSHAIGFVR